MREIKFRAWDDYRKAMSDEVDIYCETGIIWWVAQWRGEDGGKIEAFDSDGKGNSLMQYTGLKDKNGKEIWEGDIVIFVPGYSFALEDKDTFIGYVKWIDDNAGFFIAHNHYDDLMDLDVVDKVIGNIWENKELLNDNKGV